MGFRFFRRQRIAPGVTLNLSRSGASVSLGPRGAKVTIGPRGTQATVGLPGTGLFYTTKVGAKPKPKKAVSPAASDKLALGFLERLLIPAEERQLIDGLRELVAGRTDAAYPLLRASRHPDASWLAASVALLRGDIAEAIPLLEHAVVAGDALGRSLAKYDIEASFGLPITPELHLTVQPSQEGALLCLSEAYQRAGRTRDALAIVEQLRRQHPEDVVLCLSWIELSLEVSPGQPEAGRAVLDATHGLENVSAAAAACLLYRARAMRQLGMLEEARITLTMALRRKSDRPRELLLALHYDRALIYEALGDRAKAQRDFYAINALDPDYEDVAQRLAASAGR